MLYIYVYSPFMGTVESTSNIYRTSNQVHVPAKAGLPVTIPAISGQKAPYLSPIPWPSRPSSWPPPGRALSRRAVSTPARSSPAESDRGPIAQSPNQAPNGCARMCSRKRTPRDSKKPCCHLPKNYCFTKEF